MDSGIVSIVLYTRPINVAILGKVHEFLNNSDGKVSRIVQEYIPLRDFVMYEYSACPNKS